MKILKIFTNGLTKLVSACQDLLAPEDIKIKKLLALEVGMMRELLPKSPVYSKDILVLFDYQNKIVRTLVKFIKYKNNANLRKRVAIYFYEELVDIVSEITLFEGTPPLLVPMPMSKLEKRNRGFNQCEELVREIKKLGGDNIEISLDTLKKVKETQRQTTLSREARTENVKNSMLAIPMDISTAMGTKQYRTVIVLDDVYTTGASLLEARRALLASGAHRVIGIFIAH